MKIDAVALIDVLKSEKETYEELLNLAKEEQGLIIARDIAELSDIIRATERLMFVAYDLGSKRLTLLGIDQDVSQSTSDFSSIIKDLDSVSAAKVEALRSEILSIVDELSEVNQTNADLLKRSAGYVDFLLSTLLPEEDVIYSKDANCIGTKPRLFDGRA